MAAVCVTGASGYIASHVVQQLLEKGLTVHGTVRDVTNEAKVAHLKALDGAADRLKLFQADLIDASSFDEPLKGCETCFHTASPFFNKGVTDAQKQLIEPALNGTKNVLEACTRQGVKEVILTSSVAAIAVKEKPADHVVTEEDWSDEDYCNKVSQYCLSKTLAEKAAWEYSKVNGIRLVTINPTLVYGPMIQPSLNTSSEALLDFFLKKHEKIPSGYMTWIDVRDVAKAHVLSYENKKAHGRYQLIVGAVPWKECVGYMQKHSPEQFKDRLPTEIYTAEDDEPQSRYNQAAKMLFSCKKAEEELGMKFISVEDSIKDHINSTPFVKLIPETL